MGKKKEHVFFPFQTCSFPNVWMLARTRILCSMIVCIYIYIYIYNCLHLCLYVHLCLERMGPSMDYKCLPCHQNHHIILSFNGEKQHCLSTTVEEHKFLPSNAAPNNLMIVHLKIMRINLQHNICNKNSCPLFKPKERKTKHNFSFDITEVLNPWITLFWCTIILTQYTHTFGHVNNPFAMFWIVLMGSQLVCDISFKNFIPFGVEFITNPF